MRLALLLPPRFCRFAFWPWELLRLRVDWLRCVLLLVASVPSVERRGAASAGARLVAKTRPPRAAKKQKPFHRKTFPEGMRPESRLRRSGP